MSFLFRFEATASMSGHISANICCRIVQFIHTGLQCNKFTLGIPTQCNKIEMQIHTMQFFTGVGVFSVQHIFFGSSHPMHISHQWEFTPNVNANSHKCGSLFANLHSCFNRHNFSQRKQT